MHADMEPLFKITKRDILDGEKLDTKIFERKITISAFDFSN